MLLAGIAAHIAGFAAASATGGLPLTGLGPALSFAGLALAVTLLVVEAVASDVTLTLAAAPFAAVCAASANIVGFAPSLSAPGARGTWLVAHIALAFVGLAAHAAAAAAGTMYLVERRGLKARRLEMVIRLFPPLATLERVNHVTALTSWLGLTLGVMLGGLYTFAYRTVNVPQLVWGMSAWLAVSLVVFGRLVWRWQAQRAALVSSIGFVAVIALYLAVKLTAVGTGHFL